MKYIKIIITATILTVSALTYRGFSLLHQENTTKAFSMVEPNFNKVDTSKQAHLPSTLVNTPSSTIWIPKPRTTWQWQLSTPIDQSIDAQMYDIDMFNNNAEVVLSLHAKGRHVICYISAGSVEDLRLDSGLFPGDVIGNNYTHSSAEWIEEDPRYQDETLVPFDTFDHVTFATGSTTVDGSLSNIFMSKASSITLVDTNNRPIITPSVLINIVMAFGQPIIDHGLAFWVYRRTNLTDNYS